MIVRAGVSINELSRFGKCLDLSPFNNKALLRSAFFNGRINTKQKEGKYLSRNTRSFCSDNGKRHFFARTLNSATDRIAVSLMQHFVAIMLHKQQSALFLLIEKAADAWYYVITAREQPKK